VSAVATEAAPEREPYQRPTISASRLKSVGGEKGAPGCERKTAGSYLFGMKQSSSAALEFGSALHSSAEHLQETGELLDPESDVGRVLASGAHLINLTGRLLVEWEHVGTLPDGSPYVAYLDGHSPDGGPVHTVVIQDLKTTSNPRYALVGTDEEDVDDAPPVDDYDLRKDIQCMLYAWILLCDAHWYCPPLPEGHYGPKHWRWWDPAVQGAKSGRLRWIYFLTKGVARAWEANAFVTPAQAQAYMQATVLPLVARINALHEWHYSHPHATLDEIDRTPAACNNRGRWCGVGERDACNFDKLGTPALDLVQLKVRKMTTPQERLAALQAQNAAKRAAAGGVAVAPPPAPVVEAPAASPPPAPTAKVETSIVPTPAPVTTPAAAPAEPTSAAPASITAPDASAAAAELTRGQKAAATRAANKAAAQAPAAPVAPPVGINPPEGAEVAALPVPAPPPARDFVETKAALAAVRETTVCPSALELGALIQQLAKLIPAGTSLTIAGQS
jgi:hypothetical protein